MLKEVDKKLLQYFEDSYTHSVAIMINKYFDYIKPLMDDGMFDSFNDIYWLYWYQKLEPDIYFSHALLSLIAQTGFFDKITDFIDVAKHTISGTVIDNHILSKIRGIQAGIRYYKDTGEWV